MSRRANDKLRISKSSKSKAGKNLDTFVLKAKKRTQAGNRALSELLSEMDRAGASSLNSELLLEPRNFSFRIGITGPPGAGKSTLIAGLIREFRSRNLSVGVLAVDPSSPFTMGAILGDRVRYNHFHEDPNVFIRSLGTRGSLGGLSSSAYLFLRAFDACGFDVVIVETVGVGQTELEIMNVADLVSVVLVPESGDSVQAMKAGLLEIADIFVVNKADRPGSEIFARELENAIAMDESHTPVLRTTATKNEGIAPLVQKIFDEKEKLQWKASRRNAARLQAEARALLRSKIESQIEREVSRIHSLLDLKALVTK